LNEWKTGYYSIKTYSSNRNTMKFSNISFFVLFAAPIIASPLLSAPTSKERQLAKRDLLGIKFKDVIDSVVDSTNALTTAVENFNGDISESPAILEASSSLQSTIQNGTAAVQDSLSLTLAGVLVILPSVLSLNSAVEGVSNALVSKKSQFDSAGLSPVVLQQLQEQQGAAQSLVNVLITKLPPYLPTGLGEILSSPSLQALSYAISVYNH
jgi:hypothetical protein